MSSGSKTEPSVARLYECFQTGESAKVTLPVQKCVLWKGASKLSPQKKKLRLVKRRRLQWQVLRKEKRLQKVHLPASAKVS